MPVSGETLSGHGDFFNFHLFLIILHFLAIASKSRLKHDFYDENHVFLLRFFSLSPRDYYTK